MNSPRLSVIIPLYDKRVSEESCLESWCNRQTFPRDQYEVIVTSNGADPKGENRVRAALGPHDRLVSEPGANMAKLYHLGACSARSPVLLFTELHCIAKKNCLQELMKFLETHDCVGACLHTEGGCPNTFAAVECELFEEFFETWSQPQDWRKVLFRGVAIERDVYFAAGGFDERYNRFTDWILAARLDEQGYKLGYAQASSLVHYYSTSYRQFFTPVKEHVLDEYEYRTTHSPNFCHRYFGTHPDWSGRDMFRADLARDAVRVLLKGLISREALPRRKWSASAMADLLRFMRLGLLGIHPDLAMRKLRMWLAGIECWRWRNDQQRLRVAYQNAYRRIEDYYRLRFIHKYLKNRPIQIAEQTEHSIGNMSDDQFFGFHQQEVWRNQPFRWTGSIGLTLLNVPPASYELRIDTNALRGCPMEYVSGLYFNGQKLPKALIGVDAGSIIAQVDKDRFVAGTQQLAVTCLPMKTESDARPLGVPVFRMSFKKAV